MGNWPKNRNRYDNPDKDNLRQSKSKRRELTRRRYSTEGRSRSRSSSGSLSRTKSKIERKSSLIPKRYISKKEAGKREK